MTKYIRLSLSENPNSFPEKIKERIKKEIDDINLYPMDYYDEVKNILGKSYNFKVNFYTRRKYISIRSQRCSN